MMKLLDHMKGEGFLHTAQKIAPLVIDDAAAIVPTLLRMQEGVADKGSAAATGRM
jgi:hypothetical protein